MSKATVDVVELKRIIDGGAGSRAPRRGLRTDADPLCWQGCTANPLLAML